MKKLITKFVYVSFVATALLISGCQEEFEEIGNDSQEAIEADSETASLIEDTVTNDGSSDNIVDGASCVELQYPYTVRVNGVEITVEDEEDLELVEEVVDETDASDGEVLEIVFPITIVLSDFTEVVVEDQDELNEYVSQCVEDGADDDIECVDFVYPITLFILDTNDQITDEIVVSSDEELYQFLDGLEQDDLISIEYPITLIHHDGTEIVVNSNAELVAVLESAQNDCDEDDDNNHNDDDFEEEFFDEFLTECPWEIQEVIINGMDQTGQYMESVIDFDEDGNVVFVNSSGNEVDGEWSYVFTEDGALVTLDFDMLPDFNQEWLVYEMQEGVIKFYSNDNRIVLRKHCEDNDDHDDNDGGDNGDNGIISIETLTNTLLECEWIIRNLIEEGENNNELLGYEFDFQEEGMVTLSDGITTLFGTWEVGAGEEGERTLTIEIMNEASVSMVWIVDDIDGPSVVDTTWLRLSGDMDSGMTLQKVCVDDTDEEVEEINDIMLDGLWNVVVYENEEVDETENYAGMDFGFSLFNQVEVSINDDPIAAGVWRTLRDTDENLVFYLNLGTEDILGDLTEPWYVIEVSQNRLELVYEDEEVNFKTLVFEKKQ